MKRFFLTLLGLIVIILLGGPFISFSQEKKVQSKPVITPSVYNEWRSVEQGRISNDGRYVIYQIHKGGSGEKMRTIIQSTATDWKVDAAADGFVEFSLDSKYAIYKTNSDSLAVMALGRSDDIKYIPDVVGFSIQDSPMGTWIAFFRNSVKKTLVLHNLQKFGQDVEIPDVQQYLFAEHGKSLVVKLAGDNEAGSELQWIDLKDMSRRTIIKRTGIGGIVIAPNGKGLVYPVTDTVAGKDAVNVWVYNKAEEQPKLLVGNGSAGLASNLQIKGIKEFSEDGNKLFVWVGEQKQKQSVADDGLKLNVWSYFDWKLQPQQLKEINRPPKYCAVVDVKKPGALVQLEQNESEHFSYPGLGDFGMLEVNNSNNQFIEPHFAWFVVSLKNGTRIPLSSYCSLSPDGSYAVYFNQEENRYYCLESGTGKIQPITKGINVSWIASTGSRSENRPTPRGIAGWTPELLSVLIYDQNDIWQVDLQGKNEPICLTGGYGKMHQIIFSIPRQFNNVFKPGEEMVLTALNTETLDNGYFTAKIGKTHEPKQLIMGSNIFEITVQNRLPYGVLDTKKAKDAAAYLVSKMSADSSPNLYFTKDFKSFRKLTDIRPEREYNWYTTELHKWKSLDGRPLKGVLYKPENFDPSKKYPAIVYIYETRSEFKNFYIKPENLCGGCNIDIPTFVSNGYLVFSPDIYYKVGDPFQGTYNSVVSGVEHLKSLSFINGAKIGLQGCSYGAIQTNYLIGKTKLFAAAMSASGIADYISGYGSLIRGETSHQSLFEGGQNRMGASLWEIPDQYIKSSAIFNADKVTTPLLMMHTTKDGVCLFPNAVEFFTGLRRNGKKVWLLEYEEGNHGISGQSADDFAIRVRQFFDHYLMDKPAPKWMTQGRPANLKGIDERLEPDNPNVVP